MSVSTHRCNFIYIYVFEVPLICTQVFHPGGHQPPSREVLYRGTKTPLATQHRDAGLMGSSYPPLSWPPSLPISVGKGAQQLLDKAGSLPASSNSFCMTFDGPRLPCTSSAWLSCTHSLQGGRVPTLKRRGRKRGKKQPNWWLDQGNCVIPYYLFCPARISHITSALRIFPSSPVPVSPL